MNIIAHIIATKSEIRKPHLNERYVIIIPVINGPIDWPISITELNPPSDAPSLSFFVISAIYVLVAIVENESPKPNIIPRIISIIIEVKKPSIPIAIPRVSIPNNIWNLLSILSASFPNKGFESAIDSIWTEKIKPISYAGSPFWER